MLRIHSARGRFVRGSCVTPWAFTIARRLVVDRHRRQNMEQLQSEGETAVDEVPHLLGPEELMGSRQRSEAIFREASRLPATQRAAFELVYYDGLTHCEGRGNSRRQRCKREITHPSRQRHHPRSVRRRNGATAMTSKQPPSNELKARILAAAEARPSPTRKALARRSAMLTLGAWLAAFGVFEAMGGVRLTGRPISLALGTLLGTGIVAGLAGWGDPVAGTLDARARSAASSAVAIAAAPLILAWKVVWSAQYARALDAWPTRPGFKCLALSLAIAACPLVAFLLSRRFTDPRHPVVSGLIAGLAIGSLANVMTDLWCPRRLPAAFATRPRPTGCDSGSCRSIVGTLARARTRQVSLGRRYQPGSCPYTER